MTDIGRRGGKGRYGVEKCSQLARLTVVSNLLGDGPGRTKCNTVKNKSKFLYNAISNPQDCSERLIHYFLVDLFNQTPSRLPACCN